MTESPTLHIERREYKYLIDAFTAERVRECIRPFCRIDRHAEGRPRNRYTIDSLYFDTHELELYRANFHERTDRYKLRVRTYPQVAKSPVFFEVKSRFNDVIVKDRGRAPADWPELLRVNGRSRVAPVADHTPFENAAVDHFVTRVRVLQAEPKVVVRYDREPWMSIVDDYARVTFDCNIRSQRVETIGFDTVEKRWRNVDTPARVSGGMSPIVLELKFTSAVPTWMMGMVRTCDLTRRAFSKYGDSIRSWYGRGPLGRSSNRRADPWTA